MTVSRDVNSEEKEEGGDKTDTGEERIEIEV